jgi:hypothetical protein
MLSAHALRREGSLFVPASVREAEEGFLIVNAIVFGSPDVAARNR